ncbi:MAG TPA: dUTP diphosphatase [Myxococcaceae bacterium]|nr:dUTP diphosphatase [Myxococcaceae bacterium]
MTAPVLRIRRVRPHPDPLPLPAYETAQAAGLDLRADLEAPVTLAPGARARIPTGLALAIPEGHEGQIRPRSGRALREGLTCLNSPGTVDADFRGEVQVLLINLGQEPITLRRGERIAQLVIAPVRRVVLEEVETLPDSARGEGGFGSTGR